jgi:hypothetical protein
VRTDRLDTEIGQMRIAAFGSGQSGTDEVAEKRRRTFRATLELGMGLSTNPEWMVLKFDEFDEAAVRGGPGTDESASVETAAELRIEFVTMAMALGDDFGPVGLGHFGARKELGYVSAQTHRAPLLRDITLCLHEIDDCEWGLGIKLA